ncbi:testis-specific H1 histone [Mirounga angustirostris]|uniref:testis-specific H1 histone n=1 Tax=Mirounga angustirostris TaxID=9716 RepID=UPI00313CCA62
MPSSTVCTVLDSCFEASSFTHYWFYTVEVNGNTAPALVGVAQKQWPRRGGSGAMAEVAGPTGESKGTEIKTQQAPEKTLTAVPRRGLRSVLKVSQLLLRAITTHKRLTLAALKKEFGNAGYVVRRKCCRHSGDAPWSEVKGTLLRVSGSDASGSFRVWKIPKPKRRPGRLRLEEGARSSRRTLPGPRSPRRRRCARRGAAKKARELWRRSTKVNTRGRKIRPRAKDSVRSRAREEVRAKGMDEGRGRTMKEDIRPRTREEKKRPGPKPRKEKKQDPVKSVKRTIQKTALVKTDRSSSSQGKTHDLRAARTKTSTKSESLHNAAGYS